MLASFTEEELSERAKNDSNRFIIPATVITPQTWDLGILQTFERPTDKPRGPQASGFFRFLLHKNLL